jgi:hypothetical protein
MENSETKRKERRKKDLDRIINIINEEIYKRREQIKTLAR